MQTLQGLWSDLSERLHCCQLNSTFILNLVMPKYLYWKWQINIKNMGELLFWELEEVMVMAVFLWTWLDSWLVRALSGLKVKWKPTDINVTYAVNARCCAEDMPFSSIKRGEFGLCILTAVTCVLNVSADVRRMLWK